MSAAGLAIALLRAAVSCRCRASPGRRPPQRQLPGVQSRNAPAPLAAPLWAGAVQNHLQNRFCSLFQSPPSWWWLNSLCNRHRFWGTLWGKQREKGAGMCQVTHRMVIYFWICGRVSLRALNIPIGFQWFIFNM